MIITVNPKHTAKRSVSIPCFNPTAVVREVTTAECTEGIPPLESAFLRLNTPIFNFEANHFMITASKNASAGIKIKLL
jgi:hypothetical protein